jgi:acyl dehydratase
MADFKAGDAVPELRVIPDKYVTNRYAGASGDFNPIHIDPEFAKSVGLPGNILHGLYSMGLVAIAAAQGLGGGDPRAMKKLSVQFRGMGLPEQEIVVSGRIKEVEGNRVTVDLEAAQGDNRIIRNAQAELEI